MIRKSAIAFFVCALFAPLLLAASKPPKGQIVDSGSFTIYVNGTRVATEKFQIEQKSEGSVATSEVQIETGGAKMIQQSEMQLAPNGDLLRYTWHENGSNRTVAVVEPSNEFLVEHVTVGATAKSDETPFLLPHSTLVMDDYFFSHREILAWRFLASGCTPGAAGKIECKLGKTQFGVLVPQQRSAMEVSLEFTGREKVTIRGVERELTRVVIYGDDAEWWLWLDDSNKVVRMLIAGNNTEILRD